MTDNQIISRIREIARSYNKPYEELKQLFSEDFNLLFEEEKPKLCNIEDKTVLFVKKEVKKDVDEIINKLKNPEYLFVTNDITVLSTFTSNINTLVRVSNWINNFKQGKENSDKTTLDLSVLFNQIKKASLMTEITVPLDNHLKFWLPFLFSVVKHCQDPLMFPIYYRYWRNILKEVYGKEDNYQSFYEFYRTFPEEERHLNFGTCLLVIGKQIISKVKEENLLQSKEQKAFKFLKDKLINVKRYEKYLDDLFPGQHDYYIIGSKYGGNADRDVFPQMLQKSVIATGFASSLDLTSYFEDPEELEDYLVQNKEENKSIKALKIFLSLKPGDYIAVKASGSPRGDKGFLSIVGIAEVIGKDNNVYEHDPNGLGHTINVKYLKAPVYKEFNIGGYGRTIQQVTNSAHIKAIFDGEYEIIESTKEPKNIPMELNTILYGPPGTGKTYQTINKSVEICNPQFNITAASREQLKAEYERLEKDGQIEFITFHQSMSYEDFIEGIKPVEPKESDEFLKYEIKEGIFKRLCEKASKVPEAKTSAFSLSEGDFQKAIFYKMSLGDTSNPDDDQIYDWCINNGYIALGRGDANDFTGLSESDIQQMVPGKLEKFSAQALNYFIHYAKVGDYVIVSYGNLQFRAIGKITGNYEYKNVEGLQVHQFRKVQWLWTGVELPYEEIYDRQFSQQSIYKLDKRGLKKEFLVKTGNALPVDNKVKNYVLIIDEINRGNVSQIFGELITLIEEDKRAGKEEALTATLPYSKKAFSVPPNLYIIGTMNTADRSVEALDTALRRRFVFEEMKPDDSLLSSQELIVRLYAKYPDTDWNDKGYRKDATQLYSLIGIDESFEKRIRQNDKPDFADDDKIRSLKKEQFSGIDLQTLLSTINKRLEALLTKDHTIGHAWLMNVFCLEDLQSAFKNKILPLLQEFFYNDYAKIGLVLGKSFVDSKPVGKQFAKFDDELASDFADKIIYSLKDPFQLKAGDFTSIYQ